MMAAKTAPLADAGLREMLSARGLRVTGPRMTVLRELSRRGPPISHPELAERLADQGLDRVTVYRNLLALLEAGLLVRTQLSDHVWRYELPPTGGATHGLHPHLVCTDCGSVECLPKAAVRLQGAAAHAQVSEVQLRGLCTECRE
jgi:Fur family ferric uptake transcriptional regulator